MVLVVLNITFIWLKKAWFFLSAWELACSIHGNWWSLTCTISTCILGMITIMDLISVMAAVKYTRFTSITTYIIECYVPSASSVAASRGSIMSVTEPQTPADNVSVVQVPVVIAHGSPGSVVEHLNSAFPIAIPTGKSCFWISRNYLILLSDPVSLHVDD